MQRIECLDYLGAGKGDSSLLVPNAAADGDPRVGIIFQLAGPQAGGGLVLYVAGRIQHDLRLGPAGLFQLKGVFSEPVDLQLALIPW